MPTFTNVQPLTPTTSPYAWWDFSGGTWNTLSLTNTTWVIAQGERTLTFTSTSGFTAGVRPGGVVESIQLHISGVSQATVTGLTPLGATAGDIATAPAALLSRADTFAGGVGADQFNGLLGDDSLSGGAGDDRLTGDDPSITAFGADTLNGGAGDDTLDGGYGANLLLGGDGADNLSSQGGLIFGGLGNDSVTAWNTVAHGDDGNDSINILSTAGGVTTAFGDAGDDTFYASSSGVMTLDGGAGNDTVSLTYQGGALSAGQVGGVRLIDVERVVLTAAADINLASYGAANVILNSSIRADGSAGNDTLNGGIGSQTIAGGLGDDVLDGGTTGWGTYYPFNSYYPGGGNYQPPTYYVTYRDIVDYSSATNGVTVDLTITTAQNTGQGLDTLTGFEGIVGSAFNDVLTAGAGDRKVQSRPGPADDPEYLGSTLAGGAGDDRLTGWLVEDRLDGGAGADTLAGGQGRDTLDGGAGSDLMTGGSDWDVFGVNIDGGLDTIVDLNMTSNANGNGFSELDSILLTGSAAPFTGTLIFNQQTDQLFWDADGDAGAAAARLVANVAGSWSGTTFHGALLADGSLRPQIIRIIEENGTVSNFIQAPYEPIRGGAGADVVVGTTFNDTLEGLAGNDVLDGRTGSDVLYGGLGADKYHVMVDGNVDYLNDFDTAQGDFLLLVDDATTITNGEGGLLILTAQKTLYWDSDSDAGSSAAIAVAQFGGNGALILGNRGAYAAGFQPSGLRELRADGAKVETVFDWGAQSFDYTRTTYTAANQVEIYDTFFDNGSTSNRYWDVQNTQTWDSRVADYDAQGRMTAYAVYNDDGSRQVFQFDIGNTRPWERLVESYDALGRLSAQGIKNDDGTASERYVDTYDSQPWAYYIDNYSAAGALLNHTFYKADGTLFVG